MKIGIDARIYKTGIGRYTRCLLQELEGVMGKDDEVVVFMRASEADDFTPPDQRFRKVIADFPSYSFAEQLRFLTVLNREKLDLVHFTNFNVPVLWLGKYVVTIHDLIHMSHSTFGSSTRSKVYYLFKRFIYGLAIRWVAWRARVVLVPSGETKRDVVERLKIGAEKVVVTYEGVGEELGVGGQESPASDFQFSTQYSQFNTSQPFLLYVGTMYPHKNHQSLIEAFEGLLVRFPDLQLVLVGKVDYFSRKIRDLVREKKLEDKIILPNFECDDGYLPDEDLKVFYQHASVYVFPSLKEGFGIPILEAQINGLPVVCSNASCMPEIGGDSVLYFDPCDVQDIQDQVTKALTDSDLRRSLVTKGYENLKRFSWGQMARETYQVYQKVVTHDR